MEFGKSLLEGAHLGIEGIYHNLKNEATYFAKIGKASIAATSKAGSILAKYVGKGTGYLAALPDLYSFGAKPTWGNGTKLALDIGTVMVPYVGQAYGLVNLGFSIFSNTSLTDRIGTGIDNYLDNNVGILIFSPGPIFITNYK